MPLWCPLARSLPCLRTLLATGLLIVVFAGAGASPLFAHDPIVTRPRVLVMEPGESAMVVLEMVNIAGPGEPREDVETTFAVVPEGVIVTIAEPLVPSQEIRSIEEQVTV